LSGQLDFSAGVCVWQGDNKIIGRQGCLSKLKISCVERAICFRLFRLPFVRWHFIIGM